MVASALLLVLFSGRGVSSGFHTFFKKIQALFYSIGFRGGAGPRGFLGTLSQYMLSSAATFSFFLAIGSVCYSSKRLVGR